MRKATENQGNSRKLADYKKNTISKKNKVKDFGGQQCSLHFTSSHQEIPMKLSQVPNQLSPPPSRKLLPYSRAEPCCKERPGVQRHPTHSLGPITPKGCFPSSPTDSSVNRLHSKPKDRLNSPKHSIHPPVLNSGGSNHILNSSNKPHAMSRDRVGPLQNRVQTVPGVVPVSPVNGDNPSIPRPPHPCLPHPASPQFVRKSKNDSPSSHIQVDQVPESRATLSNSGSKTKSAQGQDSDKCRQGERTTSYQNVTPEFNCSSHKKRLDCTTSHDNSKKLHLQSPSFGDTQSAKPTAEDPLGNSPEPSGLEQALKARGDTLRSDACEQTTCSEPSSMTKHKQSHDMSSPKRCIRSAAGAKQALLDSTAKGVVTTRSLTHPKSGEDGVKNRNGIHKKTDRSHSSFQLRRKDNSCSTSNHHSGHNASPTSASAVKPVNKSKQTVERKKSDSNTLKPTSKRTSFSPNRPSVEKSKAPRARKHVVLPDDTEKLFTPDPLTYVVGLPRKTSKSKAEEAPPDKTATSCSSTPAPGSSCHKAQVAAPHSSSHSSASKRVKLDNISPTSNKLENSPITSSDVQLKKKSVKGENKAMSQFSNSVSSHTSEDAAASERTSASNSRHPQLERQASENAEMHMNEEDPVAMDLDLDLSLALDFDVTQSSQSSEDEQLISLKEIIERATKPPDTPEKEAFSEPSTPGCNRSQRKNKLLPSTTKPDIYTNSLDDLLKDANTNKRAKEIEMEHRTACKKYLLGIAEYEEAEENHAAVIPTEEQKFLQRYSLMSSTIREIPPGEVVFNMEKVGRIFDQDTLQLRHCMVNPQGTAQKTILWSSPAQLRLYVAIGLFQEGYDCHSPCPTPVTRFLFKMMSIHSDQLVSDGMLQALFDIALSAAYERVMTDNHQFSVWVPSLADVTLILLNMGAAFVTLYPFENLQPLFTEGDLLEDVYVKRESSFNKEQRCFAEHNYNNVFKYLSCSLGLCPRAYSDDELLLLLTVVSRVSLDPQLILLSGLNLYPLHSRIVNNFIDWDKMLPKICMALTDLTDDHHNMCYLVQLLPNNKRGRQLRQHLSMSMISKLLDGSCMYRPPQTNFQLSELRPYLLRMKPSCLLKDMQNSDSGHKNEENILDQQAYYLCYSLLTLTNEASNMQFFTAQQKEQLLYLSFELEAHVKCGIRETEKCLYRSKVKDLVARMYTKWQILLQKTKPLNNKLYDYWQPVDTLISSQEGNVKSTAMDFDETAPVEEITDDEETLEPEEDMELGEELVGLEENSSTKDTSKTEGSTEAASDNLNQVAPHMETQTDSTPQLVEMQKEA